MTRATWISDAACFKHKYLFNPSTTPKDLVIATAANQAKALKTTIPIDLRDSSMKALTDLSALFSEAALRYNNDPATHVITPETILTQPQQAPTTSPRVLPTPMPMPPPRVQPTVHSSRVPTSLPTSPPSAQPKTLFPAMTGSEEKPQAILPYKPTSTQLKKLRQSQRIANLGILDAMLAPKDGPVDPLIPDMRTNTHPALGLDRPNPDQSPALANTT
jgi:hypothetical protein